MNEKFKKAHEFFIGEGFLPHNNSSYEFLRKYSRCSLLQEKTGLMYVVWQNTYFGLYRIINDCLCSVFFHEGRDIYWTIHRPKEDSAYPLQSVIEALCELSRKAGIQFLQVKFIDEYLLAEYEAVNGYKKQTAFFLDNSEYAYTTEHLTDLAGTVNYYKRKRIKKFLGKDDICVRKITSGNVTLCLDVENEWCLTKTCSSCSSFFGCEKKAVKVMTEIYDEKIHEGLFLYINEKLSGYLICEKISEKLSFLYFGKSRIDGGLIYLIYVMYTEYIKDCGYMNISEDMGHEGLRRFKKLLSPYELWHKYVVTYYF